MIQGLPDDAEGKMHESPAQSKLPSKYTSMADLRKRARYLVDYLQKVQINPDRDREKRNEVITNSLRAKHQFLLSSADITSSLIPSVPHSSTSVPSVGASVQIPEIITNLSTHLYHWQEREIQTKLIAYFYHCTLYVYLLFVFVSF